MERPFAESIVDYRYRILPHASSGRDSAPTWDERHHSFGVDLPFVTTPIE
jgi:hypothetical protein